MKKNYITISLLFILPILSFSQAFEWVKYMGTSIFDGTSPGTNYSISDLTTDQEGNIYVLGLFKGTVDLDPGAAEFPVSSINGTSDVFIEKLTPDGDFIWGKHYGSIGLEDYGRITTDKKGNILILGHFGHKVDFDTGLGHFILESNGNTDIYILKMSGEGDFIWARSLGGPNKDGAGDILVDEAQNIYICGHFKTKSDLDPSDQVHYIESKGTRDGFVEKLDSVGNLIWVHTISGKENIYSSRLDISSKGEIYVSGIFEGSADFNPTEGIDTFESKGLFDYYIKKLDNDGNFQWAKAFGGEDGDYAYTIAVTPQDDILISGGFRSMSIDLDPDSTGVTYNNKGLTDAYIQKFNGEGKLIWSNVFGGKSVDAIVNIEGDGYGNFILTGIFSDTFDLIQNGDTLSLASHGGIDILYLKIDTSGQIHWDKVIGGPRTDFGGVSSIDPFGNIVIAGTFQDTVDFNTDSDQESVLTAPRGYGVFIQKLSQCDLNVTVTDKSPLLLSNSKYTSYQWVDCEDGYNPIMGENAPSFLAKRPGNYAVIVSNHFCSDTSACIRVTSVRTTNEKEISTFDIFPNPTSGLVNIDFKRVYPSVQVSVSDIYGQCIYRSEYTNRDGAEFWLNAPNGLYLVEIHLPGGIRYFAKLSKH